MKKTGIIIQARTGSTRLPSKMTKSFYNQKSILEILLDRFNNENKSNLPLVVATTRTAGDDAIEIIANNSYVPVFRGDEDDVLKRFIEAARLFHFEKIVRICADNPLLDIEGTLALPGLCSDKNWDYLGYRLKGNLPSILTHTGFWGEWVTLKALETVNEITKEKVYHEHVTNYIYSHAEKFKVKFIDVQDKFFTRTDIRLTVDTPEDFTLVKEVYQSLKEYDIPLSVENIIHIIDDNPDYLKRMSEQIRLNEKSK